MLRGGGGGAKNTLLSVIFQFCYACIKIYIQLAKKKKKKKKKSKFLKIIQNLKILKMSACWLTLSRGVLSWRFRNESTKIKKIRFKAIFFQTRPKYYESSKMDYSDSTSYINWLTPLIFLFRVLKFFQGAKMGFPPKYFNFFCFSLFLRH